MNRSATSEVPAFGVNTLVSDDSDLTLRYVDAHYATARDEPLAALSLTQHQYNKKAGQHQPSGFFEH